MPRQLSLCGIKKLSQKYTLQCSHFFLRSFTDTFPSNKVFNHKFDDLIKRVLRAVILPIINEHHTDEKYIFWPDLARANYSKRRMSCLMERST